MPPLARWRRRDLTGCDQFAKGRPAVGRDGRSRDAAAWYDRRLPGVLARIGPHLDAYVQNRSHVKPSYDRAVPPELVLSGDAPEAIFIEQMGRVGRPGPQ
jgi:hypothetical protein